MLPFLKRNDRGVGGLIVKTREPDQPQETDDGNDDLEACARDLMAAMNSGDAKQVAQVMADMFEVLKSHPDDDSYDAQNEKAAEYE